MMLSHPPHFIFAPGVPWKRPSPAYKRMHANIRGDIAKMRADRQRSLKRAAHCAKSLRFKTKGE
jgi:hypothetical protein